MNGVQLPQDYKATTKKQFTFLPLGPQGFLALI